MSKTLESHTWDISQERAFLENLICQRFNFFLIFFSIVSAGAVGTAKISIQNVNLFTSALILFVGVIICWLMQMVLHRTQEKLDIILDQLLPENHPMRETDKIAKKGGSKIRYIGELIPTLCCWVLTIALFLEVVIQIKYWN